MNRSTGSAASVDGIFNEDLPAARHVVEGDSTVNPTLVLWTCDVGHTHNLYRGFPFVNHQHGSVMESGFSLQRDFV